MTGRPFQKLRTVDQHQPALARRRRLVRLECHAFCLPFSKRQELGPAYVIGWDCHPGYRAPKVPGFGVLSNNSEAPTKSGAKQMGSFTRESAPGQAFGQGNLEISYMSNHQPTTARVVTIPQRQFCGTIAAIETTKLRANSKICVSLPDHSRSKIGRDPKCCPFWPSYAMIYLL